MEHLPIHLPYEARVGGPVQYRRMYPFERFIRSLKQKVTNPAYVESSISRAYLLEETATFALYYYPPTILSRRTRVPRNDDGGEGSSANAPLSIFNYPSRSIGKGVTSTLEDREMKAAHLYILLNCPEVVPYLNIYSNLLRELNPDVNEADLDREISSNFTSWFKTYVLDSTNGIDEPLLRSLAWGPFRNVIRWPTFAINGYKFMTKSKNEGMSTTNHNVCVRGGQHDTMENDYYGVLIDIVELEYTNHPTKKKNSSDETPTCWDLFEKTHKMKGEASKWVSSKSERIVNEYESRILERDSQEALGDGVSSEQSDNNIFLEVVGGVDKKKRIFGLGSEGENQMSEYMQMKSEFSNLTAENQSLRQLMSEFHANQEKLLKFM